MNTTLTLNKTKIEISAKSEDELLLNVKTAIINDIHKKIERLQNEYDRVCAQPTINDLTYLGYDIKNDDHDEMIEKLRNIDFNIDPFAQNY